MLSPNVSPPKPHNTPKNIDISLADEGDSFIIGINSPLGTKIRANTQGAMSHAATPWTIQ